MTNPLADDLDFILSHTAEVWQELRGQTVFITGGTGFFGCWLLESLCWANDHLDTQIKATVLSRDPEAFARKAPHLANHPGITWLKGDVKDFEFPAGAFPYVIHAASEGASQVVEKTPLAQFDTIVSGTRHVLDFAATHGTRKLLFTSSGAVYGKQPPELSHIPEEYLGAPDVTLAASAYGEAKRAAEMMCQLFARQYGFEVKIARCFAFVGPYLPLDANFAIGNFIHDAMRGDAIVIKGDGTPYRSYLYAADLAIWLWMILIKGQDCSPYNVGSEKSLSIKEIAQTVAKSVSPRVKIEVNGQIKPNQPAERYIPEIRKAITDLELKQIINLDNAIDRTLKFLKFVH